MFQLKSIIGLIFFGISISAYSQAVDKDSLDLYIQNAVTQYDLPGLTISITNEEEVLFSDAYGVKSQKNGDKVDTETIFAIASLSKAFTAAALGILVDEGKIEWNDKVVKYIPEFQLIDTSVSNSFTIEDLVSHRSGYKTFDGDLLWYGTDYSRNEIIKRFREHKMSYGFREKYGYQNIMFIVAGEIIPALTNLSWDEFIKTRIFEPLEMNSSYTSINEFPKDINLAKPHVKGKLDAVRNYDNSGGAAAINSNVEDLTKWLQMWLNEGIVDGDTIINPSTVRELLNLNTPIDPSAFDRKNEIEFEGYAMGWFLMQYDGKKVAHHGGGLPGYISKIFMVPSQKIAGVILSNGETSLPHALMYKMLDEFLPTDRSTDWAGLYHGFSERYQQRLKEKQEKIDKERKEGTEPSFDLTEYEGTYTDKMYGDATIKLKDGQLFVRLLPAEEIFSSKLNHWEGDSFEIKFEDGFLPRGFINFESKDGEVKAFTIDLPNPDFHFYNLHFVKNN